MHSYLQWNTHFQLTIERALIHCLVYPIQECTQLPPSHELIEMRTSLKSVEIFSVYSMGLEK